LKVPDPIMNKEMDTILGYWNKGLSMLNTMDN